ncbi:hypothetical protein LOTGIDRAFT_163683 [Lottia gigantea]|uniref:Uncharacterized protein n=1 Tax=Lottia gigantea TaxID=225164 RepID=V3ZHP9_LOTGI|nr:hypothetical protein LOTGIDRAFT_163683 [Lottia gigantea]ESO90798.1 hypothetical protein LOTGIDRAFT_163683 [Lottia gigantea]
MSMIIAQTPKTYFGSDIQKSLGSLPEFPWAKYPGERHLPGHNYTGPGTRLDLRLDQNDKPKPVSDWIPDVGDGRVLEVPIRNVPNDSNEDRMRAIDRNTIERVGRAGSITLTGESTTWPITNTIKPARYLIVGFKNLPDSQTNNNNIFRVAMNETQDPIIRKVQVRLNNDNYPNQPLTINPSTKDYNELYRNYKNMCELFGNPPQFEYVDFAINHPIFCFDLSAHQEDLFKTGVNINIHIEKHTRRCNRLLFIIGRSKTFIKISDRRMIRIE